MKALLRPTAIRDKLIRVGQRADGAYIIPQGVLEQCEVLYSYGVADNIHFDRAYHEITGNPAHLYDHTVSAPANLPGQLKFHAEGLSGVKTGRCDNYLAHLQANHDEQRKVLLKIDVEGAEYDWLRHTDVAEVARTAICIVLEFHGLSTNRETFTQCLQKLKSHYHIVHLHGNNCVGSVAGFPEVIELTLVHQAAATFGGPVKVKYPVAGLDHPNAPAQPEPAIDYRAWYFSYPSRAKLRIKSALKAILRHLGVLKPVA